MSVLIAVKLFLELLQGKALFRTGQAGNHVAYQQLPVVFRHLLEAGFGPGLFRVGVIGFRTGALQQEEVESDEGRAFEAQGAAAVGKLVARSVRVQSSTGMKLYVTMFTPHLPRLRRLSL